MNPSFNIMQFLYRAARMKGPAAPLDATDAAGILPMLSWRGDITIDYRMAKMRFKLRQMEVFRAVMLTGSMNGAAKLLFVSQPAVSRLIAHTE